jgi:mannobiose 2-epimerase
LQRCAEIIEDENWIQIFKQHAIKITDAAVEGWDKDGGMWYEFEPSEKMLTKEKHWWVQAEAMIGFLNAWQLSGDEKYLHYSIDNWQFIKEHIIDKENGEWFWGVLEDGEVMKSEDKVGMWKCPYHNGRACIEIIKRIG